MQAAVMRNFKSSAEVGGEWVRYASITSGQPVVMHGEYARGNRTSNCFRAEVGKHQPPIFSSSRVGHGSVE